MHHINGTLIAIIALSIAVFHFFGFKVLLWCALACIIVIVLIFFYMIFRDEGWFPDVEKLPKKIWKSYVKWEKKFFKWIDEL